MSEASYQPVSSFNDSAIDEAALGIYAEDDGTADVEANIVADDKDTTITRVSFDVEAANIKDQDESDSGVGTNMKEIEYVGFDYPTYSVEGRQGRHSISRGIPPIPDFLQSCCFSGMIGRLYVWKCGRLWGERIWCMMGPCWPMMLLTFSLIIGIAGTTLFWASHYFHPIAIGCGFILLTINVTGLALTSCNNPGILKRHTEKPPGTNWKFHPKAKAYQPPGSKYCEETQVFVHGYDHFCPWTGTAIAGNNLPFFYCFVSSLNILCIMTFMLVFMSLSAAAAASRIGRQAGTQPGG